MEMTSADNNYDNMMDMEDLKRETHGLLYGLCRFLNFLLVFFGVFTALAGLGGLGGGMIFLIGVVMVASGQIGICLQDIRYHSVQETEMRRIRKSILRERKLKGSQMKKARRPIAQREHSG